MLNPDSKARNQRERLRRSFQPESVRLLFVGESPPASGRFFYRGDSGLYRAMLSVFRSIDPLIDESTFFATFQSSGCYLIDLCAYPVDDLDPKSRKAACLSSEASLSRLILRLQPLMIVTVVRSIENNVRRSALRAGWIGPFLHLPYPGRWSRSRKVFVEALVTHAGDRIHLEATAGIRSNHTSPHP